jgi:hypothetical protein
VELPGSDMRLVMEIQCGRFSVDSIGDDAILPGFPWEKIRVWRSRYVARPWLKIKCL